MRTWRTCWSRGACRPSGTDFALITLIAPLTGRPIGAWNARDTRGAGLAGQTGLALGARRPWDPLRALRARNTLRTLKTLRPLRTFGSLAATRQQERSPKGRNDEN